jgi:hypothetical protein
VSTVNVEKLTGELAAAGVPVYGVNSNGVITFDPSATDAQKATAATVLAAHDPSPTPAQKLKDRPVPPLLVAALAVRASSVTTAAQKTKALAIIDSYAPQIIDLLT